MPLRAIAMFLPLVLSLCLSCNRLGRLTKELAAPLKAPGAEVGVLADVGVVKEAATIPSPHQTLTHFDGRPHRHRPFRPRHITMPLERAPGPNGRRPAMALDHTAETVGLGEAAVTTATHDLALTHSCNRAVDIRGRSAQACAFSCGPTGAHIWSRSACGYPHARTCCATGGVNIWRC